MTTATASATAPRILVVDDELGPRESLRMLLKPTSQIHTAESGRAALALLPDVRPDVVILDIKMPEMDGLEVLRRVKRHDPTVEVVMITAYASLETVKLALTHGAFEYLIKPFSRQDLEDVVRRALVRRRLGRRPGSSGRHRCRRRVTPGPLSAPPRGWTGLRPAPRWWRVLYSLGYLSSCLPWGPTPLGPALPGGSLVACSRGRRDP